MQKNYLVVERTTNQKLFSLFFIFATFGAVVQDVVDAHLMDRRSI
ncbi:MAG: hypothetical protein ABI416_00135 [Ginsengibacter sp.]